MKRVLSRVAIALLLGLGVCGGVIILDQPSAMAEPR